MTPDEDRELVGLLKSYGRLETLLGRVEERLSGTEADVTAIRTEHREAVREFMGALKELDVSCGRKVDGVKKLIEDKAAADRRDREKKARAESEEREKRQASSRAVAIAVIAASATVLSALVAAAAAILTGGG